MRSLLRDLCSSENDSSLKTAAVILMGETSFCEQTLESLPLPKYPRKPKETDMFELSSSQSGWKKEYIGSYQRSTESLKKARQNIEMTLPSQQTLMLSQ